MMQGRKQWQQQQKKLATLWMPAISSVPAIAWVPALTAYTLQIVYYTMERSKLLET